MYELTDISGIGSSKLNLLKKAKIKTVEDLANATVEILIKIDGIGKSSATKWINEAKTKLQQPSLAEIKFDASSSSKIGTTLNGNQNLINNILSDVKELFNIVKKLDSRLIKIEKSQNSNLSGLSRSPRILEERSNIKDLNLFANIVKEAIEEISMGKFGVNKISLKELFLLINKHYSISKERFSKFLINLHNTNKIQLEPGLLNKDFYIKDNYGNLYTIIRTLE